MASTPQYGSIPAAPVTDAPASPSMFAAALPPRSGGSGGLLNPPVAPPPAAQQPPQMPQLQMHPAFPGQYVPVASSPMDMHRNAMALYLAGRLAQPPTVPMPGTPRFRSNHALGPTIDPRIRTLMTNGGQ